VQKEAFILQRPCITLRSETEWIETVNEGWNLLLNPDDKDITGKIKSFKVPDSQKAVFGEGVGKKMVKLIEELF